MTNLDRWNRAKFTRSTQINAQAAKIEANRAVETSINSLASDMRVTREILERLEQGQARRQVP